ncbi:MAG: hypothetical protein M3295_00870, partial [Chloroflexota bacterium]|nr:hypothetical protein [Chloroflexota bacterium]
MDDRTDLIPAFEWAVAETVDRAWVVAAAWLFGVTALVAMYLALTGIAAADPLRAATAAPAVALLAAFMLVDPR